MKNVLFYVGGHGYGHATRMSEVIRSLTSLRPDWTVHVASSAPRRFFLDRPGTILRSPVHEIDSGACEKDSLTIDPRATLDRVETLFHHCERLIDTDAAFVRRERIDLIVADIPYLAGYIAEASRVPCLGIGNFTWDWIYEPFCAGDPLRAPLLEWVRGGYKRMGTYLKLPFSHPVSLFGEVVEVPLLARRSGMSRDSISHELSIDPGDARPRVLLGMRGFPQPELLEVLARDGRDFLFLHLEPFAGPLPPNARQVPRETPVGFPELLSACDVVVSKLGYGMLAEAVTAGISLLYPPRVGFREDDLLRASVSRYLRSREIPLADFQAGRWVLHLHELLSMSSPTLTMESDGALVCATEIIQRVEG